MFRTIFSPENVIALLVAVSPFIMGWAIEGVVNGAPETTIASAE